MKPVLETDQAQNGQLPKMGIALIGAGMIGQTHVSALSALSAKASLHIVMTRRPGLAQYLVKHYSGAAPVFSADLSSIINNPQVQIVIVATPPSVRIELIEALAKAGKHILLEKPVARNLAEAIRVVELTEYHGVNLGVVFQHRMRTTSKHAAQLIANGSLGKMSHAEIAAPLWRPQSYYDELERGTYARDGGGVLITQAIHTIDLALSLTGPVASVQAMTATTSLHRMEAEDFAVAGLKFSNGAVGSLLASTANYPPGKDSITLHCEHATMRLRVDALEVFWRDGRDTHKTEKTVKADSDVSKHRWHQLVIEDFIDSIQQQRAPMVSGRKALDSHRLIEAMEASSRTGVAVNVEHN